MYELPNEQRNLIERFEAAFNRVDRELRNRTQQHDEVPLGSVIARYAREKRWRDSSEFKRFAKLRNVIVHEKTQAHRYLAIPTQEVVSRLEAI